MIRTFKAERDLSADEAAIEGALESARNSAFKEALRAAIAAYGSPDLPQDHSIEDADHPLADGGHHVEVVFTLDM